MQVCMQASTPLINSPLQPLQAHHPLTSHPLQPLQRPTHTARRRRRPTFAHSANEVVHVQQDTEDFHIEGKRVTASQIIDLLTPFLSERRIERIEKVVASRTKQVLPIVEGLYDMGNLAAVCRSADAFGLADVHCIKNSNDKYKQSSRTSAGADKWLDVKVWNSTAECLNAVKSAGYQIVATHLTRGSVAIQDVDFTRPTAFILGNEKMGVSDEAVDASDACAIIEMSGFVESFNISVAAALVMYEARQQRQQKLGYHGDLTPSEAESLKASMMMRTVKEPDTLISELLRRPLAPWQKKFEKKDEQ